jgi:hypothetical protein
MRYISTYEETKILNYILSVNENNQINEGLVDRIKEVAEKGLLKVNTIKDLLAKGVLTAGVITTLLSSSPAFAKEYKSLDTNTKNKIEKIIKTDTSDHSDSTTQFGGGGTPPDTLSINLSNNFKSGQYLLNKNEVKNMTSQLSKLNNFISKTGKNSFKITIYSSESQVPMEGMDRGVLAKLRAQETEKILGDYLLNSKIVFKTEIKDTVGKTPYDEDEATRIGVDKARKLKKYTDEQYVRIKVSALDFPTPCNWHMKAGGKILTAATDYSETTKFDVTGQVGQGEIQLSPGGIPDRVQVFIDGNLIGDSGFFVDGDTSVDANKDKFTYLPRYVYELTKLSLVKGSVAVKDSSQKRLITKTFASFDDLLEFLMTPEAKASGYDYTKKGTDTGNYIEELKLLWQKKIKTFVFYDKDPYLTNTPVKIKFKLNKNKRVEIKIISPIGKTDYTCDGSCQ